jgi:hypothetical protein
MLIQGWLLVLVLLLLLLSLSLSLLCLRLLMHHCLKIIVLLCLQRSGSLGKLRYKLLRLSALLIQCLLKGLKLRLLLRREVVHGLGYSSHGGRESTSIGCCNGLDTLQKSLSIQSASNLVLGFLPCFTSRTSWGLQKISVNLSSIGDCTLWWCSIATVAIAGRTLRPLVG